MSNSRLTRSGQTRGETRKAFSSAVRDNVAKFFQGTFLESFDALVIEDTGAVKMTLEQAGGGDLTMWFSDGYTILDCTPIIDITLTEGVDAENPQKNYVYVLQSAKVLAVSTTGWPATEHIKVGFFLIQTDVEVAARGALINQNWNDHVADTAGDDVGQGHLTHITQRTRSLGAIWLSGAEGVATQDGNDLWVSIASGIVSQLHLHTFSALDSDTAGASDPILVVNDPDAAYTLVNSLNEITKLSDGSAIGNNKYIKIVVWAVANKSGELSPIMANVPSGQYNTSAQAITDVQGYANFTIPAEFKLESTTGFLVVAFVCQHTATAMLIDTTIDQRGNTPSTATGAGTGGGDVTAAAVLADNAITVGDSGAKGIQDRTASIADNGVVSVPGIGDGGLTNYDLKVGNTADYGMIQIGNALVGRTSYKVGAIDLDGTVIIRNIGGPVTGEIEFLVTESVGNTCRFALPKSAVGNATYNPRSLLNAGPAPADTDFVKVSYWQTQGIFHNLACDTAGSGADLGVQNDLEVEGNIYADTIIESTPGAGVTVDGRDVGADGAVLDTHVADVTDPHGATMFVSVQLNTPKVQNAGGDITLDAANAAAHSTVYVLNSDATFQADLNVERNIIVGGTVDGRDISADGGVVDIAVTAAAGIADNALMRGDGGARGSQSSVALLTDAGAMSGLTQLDAGNIRLSGNILSVTSGAHLQLVPGLGFDVQAIATGGVQIDEEVVQVHNLAWASSMVDTQTSLAFYQAYNSGGDVSVAGRVTAGTETNWTSTFSTRDSFMAFHTVLDNVLSERVRINSDGQVGIGTTTPASISGSNVQLDIRRENDRCGIGLYTYHATANRGSNIYGARSRGDDATPVIVNNGDRLFTFLAMGYDGSANWRTAAFITFNVDGAPSLGNMPTNIIFNTGVAAGSARLTIQSDGDILVDSGTSVFVRDSALGFNSSVDGQFDIFADTEVEITTPTIDLNAATIITCAAPLQVVSKADATRGAAGTAGRVIFNTDDGQLNIDDGTNWTLPDGTTT